MCFVSLPPTFWGTNSYYLKKIINNTFSSRHTKHSFICKNVLNGKLRVQNLQSHLRNVRQAHCLSKLTRKLCYRKDDRAMRHIHGCPENFRDSQTTPTAIIPNSFHGLLFGSTI